MRKMLLPALALLALLASPTSAQNLLDNPSFEDPTVDMGSANDVWFRFGSGVNGVSSESTVMPRTGSRHISLQTVGPNQFAGVFQNLNMAVSPGQIVTFTGWHKSVGTDLATHELKLEWQGTPNPPQNRLDVLNVPTDYTMFTHTGVAPAGTTGLVVTYAISTFGPGQGDSTTYIDDFSLTIIPEPATAGVMGMGLLGLIGFIRRRR
jgi:hypothetical protein